MALQKAFTVTTTLVTFWIKGESRLQMRTNGRIFGKSVWEIPFSGEECLASGFVDSAATSRPWPDDLVFCFGNHIQFDRTVAG